MNACSAEAASLACLTHITPSKKVSGTQKNTLAAKKKIAMIDVCVTLKVSSFA